MLGDYYKISLVIWSLLFSVQVPTLVHVEEKWQSVYDHLEAAPTGNKAQMFLTYSSGAGVFAFPKAIAQRVNAQLYDYLSTKKDLNQRLGIICMDFPAAPMIQMITDFQLKEVTKRRKDSSPVISKWKKMRKHFNTIWAKMQYRVQ